MQYINLTEILKERRNLDHKGILFIERSDHEEFLSYKDLYASALDALYLFQAKGIKPKDELVFQIESNKTFIVTFWACIIGGIIPIPISVGNNDDHKQKFFNVWKILRSPSLIINRANLKKLEAFAQINGFEEIYRQIQHKIIDESEIIATGCEGVLYVADKNDVAFIQFSSGSTGNPKGVILTHENLIANISAISSAAKYSEDDSMISWMPLTHDMGMIGFHLNPLFCGMDQYLIPTNIFIRRPTLWLEKASEYKVTILCSPNFGYNYLLKYLDMGNKYAWDLSNVKIIYNGAEPVSESVCSDFLTRLNVYGLKSSSMCPVYGLAEASLAVSISGIEDDVISCHVDRNNLKLGNKVSIKTQGEETISFVNVGRPISYLYLRITNGANGCLQNETIGHIEIYGANITRGYYNDKEATRNAFTKDGWLKTGDLGFIKNECLYVTGRSKDILFVNGQNYYPHDIERVAEKIEGIELNKIAVAGFFNMETQKEETIAFIFNRGSLDMISPVIKSLRALINSKIGFVIDRIIPVKDIPKTTSGKVQRFKLVEQYKKGQFKEVEQRLNKILEESDDNKSSEVALVNDNEQKLIDIWKRVLRRDTINVTQRFFEIGGNSLKAAEMMMVLTKELEVELPIEILYQKQTIKELASEIKTLRKQKYNPIPVASKADYYNVSSSQKRLYYFWEINKLSISYNNPIAFKIVGEVEIDRLEENIKSLILRHDSLRMSFHRVTEPEFKIHENIDFSMGYIFYSDKDLDSTLKQLVQPFDLSEAPLFRTALLKGAANEFVLFIDFHHIVSDGVSIWNFVDELMKLYTGTKLSPLPVQYKDYLCWEKENLESDKIKSQEAYWIKELAEELPILEMPINFTRPVIFNSEGKKFEAELNRETVDKLKRIASANECSLHVLMFTLYSVMLSKYTGQENMVIGIPVAGRRHPDLQNIHGMFVNNLAINAKITENESFIQLLKRQKAKVNEALKNQDYPFDYLVNSIGDRRDISRNPIFDNMFIYQNIGPLEFDNSKFKMKKYFFDAGFSKFDISLEVLDDNDQMKFAFEYSTQLFKEETISRLSMGFEEIINKIIENPEIRLADLSPLSAEEFQNVIITYNATGKKTKLVPVSELFEQQVKSCPQNIALEFKQQKVTYAELDIKVIQVASALKSRIIGKGDIVGIHLKRSPELIIAVLGVLKAGAAYLPMENDMPMARIKFIVEDSNCKLLISDSLAGYSDFGNKALDILTFESLLSITDARCSLTRNNSKDLAYVIYTSGTTGQPKGVMIEHGSLSNYVIWGSRQYVGEEKNSFALYSSISFDLTVTSIFIPLVTGNKIFIYDEDDTQVSIASVIKNKQINVVKLTPSHLRVLVDNNLLSSGSEIRKLIVGGEVLDTQLARDVYERMGEEVEIFNEYGPTEATVGCMIYKFDLSDVNNTVPIGRPIANTQIYLLDKYLRPVSGNTPGDIYIAGEGLARGYLFLEALTNEKFVENPYIKGKNMFKTGDRAKRLLNGNLEFLGRNDNQIKISGYRVELSEIESQLIKSGQVREVVVLVDKKKSNNILAYFIPLKSGKLLDVSLRNYLAERLPYYMIPKEFIPLEFLPLTANGKVDYVKLLSIRSDELNSKKTGPRNEIERVFVKTWINILNVDEIGIRDNFYELGGDSIKAVQISSRLFEEGISIKVKDILTYHTIENISRYGEAVSGQYKYNQGLIEGEFQPTAIQYWFFSHKFKNPNYYNQSVLFKLKNPLDINNLEKAFKDLINHHDTLRINYSQEQHCFFYNNEHLNKEIVIQKFEVGFDSTLNGICEKIKRSFDISSSLLIKTAIIEEGSISYLFITAHHLIMDGISWRIFLEDLQRKYLSFVNGLQASLPQKTGSFKDWSMLVYQLFQSATFEQEKEYWKEIEETSFSLPQDFETDTQSKTNLKKISFSLEEEVTGFLLKGAHKSYNTDVPILLNVALLLTLNEWTGLKKFVIEQESHGRHSEALDTSRTIGWFSAIYPVMFVYKENIGELIKSVKEALRRVPQNGIGYGINRFLSDEADRTVKLSEIRLNYLGQFGTELDNKLMVLSDIFTDMESDPFNAFTTKLELNSLVIGNNFQAEFIYDSGKFEVTTINRLAQSFVSNLSIILEHLKNEDNLHFTPTDFTEVDLDEEEINNLFGDS
jgi:amino acid adenylation domain-containing protein/non-ribosomal peptide synthase protein (TIGR01720 family)